MRCTPIGVWAHKLPEKDIVKLAIADSALTHCNSATAKSCAAYSLAIAHLMRNPGDNEGAFATAYAYCEQCGDAEVFEWIQQAKRAEKEPYGPRTGFVRIGFSHAFRHLLLKTPYVEAVKETILGGGDTDTNACIVGGLVGALHGYSSIPEYARQKVETCDTTQKLTRTRPEFLRGINVWPGLVEKLVLGAPAALAEVNIPHVKPKK
eukprot:TRINITY_DN26575_c0_g1_i1.p1 TRINITY_DN26575_c0_g1~~TRINITY_DN26575_c0_g1_i1.p1  ORF type:complete len:207 (-),score=10.40 TRINITY_DN26575_c0_g1_i1:99-719(-)